MIKKEYFKTREDGVVMYMTYSDTDHQIVNKCTGVVYDEAIDATTDEDYEEADAYIDIEGAESYEEVLECLEATKNTSRKINRLNLTNNEALSVKELYPTWESKIGNTLEYGFIVLYKEQLWRVRQQHTALEVYPPSVDTASLYERIDKEHIGDKDDPIPYTPPMEIFSGKYYTQDGVTYLCTRDSGTALSHNLGDLVGLYVIKI